MQHTHYQLARQAIRLFKPTALHLTTKAARRYQQRAWLRSICLLGNRWLFAAPINPKQGTQ